MLFNVNFDAEYDRTGQIWTKITTDMYRDTEGAVNQSCFMGVGKRNF